MLVSRQGIVNLQALISSCEKGGRLDKALQVQIAIAHIPIVVTHLFIDWNMIFPFFSCWQPPAWLASAGTMTRSLTCSAS